MCFLLPSTTLAMVLAIEHILAGSSCLGFVFTFAVSIAVTMSTMVAMVAFPTAVVIVASSVLMSMPRLIFWHIDVIIPLIFYKIDGAATGIILMGASPVLARARTAARTKTASCKAGPGREGHPTGEASMTAPACCVGIDVAKATLDVAVRPSGEAWSGANEDAGSRRW